MPLQVHVPTEGEGMSDQAEVLNLEGCECDKRRPDGEGDGGTDGKALADHEAAESEKNVSCLATEGPEAPDGGWGWVVALGSAVIMTLIPVMGPCFGILFSRYLLQEGTSSTTTSWIFGVQTFLWNSSSLLVRALSQEFGWKAVGIGGCLLASLGFTITSFAPTPEFLFFSFSILCGIGGGVVSCLCFIVVPSYFNKRRGAANAIMSSGTGVGQMTVPPLVIFLQETFGDRGATLVYSGIMLHAVVAAATFHPVEWHSKAPPSTTTQGYKARAAISPPGSAPARSFKSIIFVRVAKSAVSDLAILRSMRAWIVCVVSALNICHLLNFMMLVPFALQEGGFSLEFSAWCISITAVSSLVSRLLCSLLSDLPFVSVRLCYVSGCAIMALTMAVVPLLSSPDWLMAVMVVYGVGMGAMMGLFSLVMIDVMGMHRLAPLFGTCSLFNGITLLVLGPVIGVIRDASQSYAVSIWVMSGLATCSTLLWALMGQATKYDKQRREEGRPDL